MPARNGVFISYAHGDAEKFASVLRQRLEIENIPVWQDHVGEEGGRDWWLLITEALDRVEFLALVMSPNALTSQMVRKEWRHARQQGVCIYPIKGAPNLEFEKLPRWMRDTHFYDLGTVETDLNGPEWQKFINDLRTRCQTKRVPFMVEDLPEGFVPRPGEFTELLNLLIDGSREEPVAITAALKGAGGYGKTTLAKALCHDERIQEAFDDGILWVTLGENPGDLTGRVEDLIVTLGDERPGFTTQDAAVNRLKELLADRDILIVIDDVWDRAHLNPFIQGGSRCARLITTRNFDTLPAGAERVHVDAMQQHEATSLLAVGLAPDDGLWRDLKQLASRLGEWPLLLRLVNGALRSRIENDLQSRHDAVTWINRALDKRGLAYFDARKSDERHDAVAKTIGVSLDLLNSEERERYAELAIFPEDAEIPLATLEKLWRKSEFDTEELCSRLNSFSLLWSYDADRRRIRLHDVIRKFLLGQYSENLSSIHTQFLDACRPPASRWADMSEDEPYLWDYLAHHLVEAGSGNELVATVKDWRYLVAKTLLRKSLAVEADLRTAENIASQDRPLRLLRRHFVNSGHLLNLCEKKDDVEVALFSRLIHLEDLKTITTDLRQYLKRPYLMPASTLPDLPHPALIRTLSAQQYGTRACAMSGDGKTVISASYDRMVKVWDALSGAERFTLKQPDIVFDCAVSADGTTIVTACHDKTLRVWDGQSGVERCTLRGHKSSVSACAVSADGMTIGSASSGGYLKVWDVLSAAERFTLKGYFCALSADGGTIVTADDNGLKVRDGRSGTERFTLSRDANVAKHSAVSADGTTIVARSSANTLKVWDGRSGNERFTLIGHSAEVLDCAVSADGMTIVSVSDDKTIKVWDGRSGAEQFTLHGHAKGVHGCAVSADGTTIVSCSYDHTLKMWDAVDKSESIANEPFTLHRLTRWGHGCAMSADGKTIVSAWDESTVNVWDESANPRLVLSTKWLNDCALSADGFTIVLAGEDGTVKAWDSRDGVERFAVDGHDGPVNSCAANTDGTIIVSASNDDTLKVWDGRTGLLRLTLRGHLDWVRGCAVSPDGTTIVSASDDQTLKVWDGQVGAERFTLSGHTKRVLNCALSADGTTIVSGSWDQSLKVWDARRGVERLTLSGHAATVWDCAVSADGATIISAGEDSTLKVWDGRTGACLSTLRVDGLLNGCACSSDAERVVATGARGVYFLRLVR